MDFYKSISQLFQKLRILSIDIVLGALSGGLMAVKVFDVLPVLVWWFVLALAVWIIYTADHLIDANKLKARANSKRRYFYFKNFRAIIIAEFILIVITAYLSLTFFDDKTVCFGIAMAVFVAIYLLAVQIKGSEKQIWLQKELIVAFVYTIGIWAVPVLESEKVQLSQIMIVISFFITVWADILLIALFEIKNDKHDGFSSLPIMMGEKKTTVLINVLFAFSVIIALSALSQNLDRNIMPAALILVLIDVVLIISLKYQICLIKNERYRLVAETVFLFPLFMLLF